MRLSFEPRPLDDPAASPEESATAGVVKIEAGGLNLSEGVPFCSDELLRGPLVSAYPLAEWLLWNWWRLRWEPAPNTPSRHWNFAHRLAYVGSGYLWPNVELASDGSWMRISSAPSADPHPSPFRYVGAPRSVAMPAAAFDEAVDSFAHGVLGSLDRAGLRESNLQLLSDQLARDRRDDHRSAYCRIEALLGLDPGEGNERSIERRIADGRVLGEQAVLELAAETAPISAAQLREESHRVGIAGRPGDAVKSAWNDDVPAWASTEAWQIGVALARALRSTEGLDGEPIASRRLADMAGVQPRALDAGQPSAEHFSFLWCMGRENAIALRSKWSVGRRFDLARLMVDRWLPPGEEESLSPATRSYTYRQKAQRAFAAELLAPIEALDDYLAGDLSDARQEDAAEHFQVSTWAIRSILLNNGRLARDQTFGPSDRA